MVFALVDQGYSGKNFAQAVKQICGDSVRVEVIERKSKDNNKWQKQSVSGILLTCCLV